MIISPYKDGFVDAPVMNILQGVDTDIPIVFVTKFSDFVFNEKLYELDKWVLADFGEMGANDWDRKDTLLWGRNSQNFRKAQTDEWRKFDEFVRTKPPLVYFKRELLQKDFKDNVYPIEFPSFNESIPTETKNQFNARPISVFHAWGWSHESRRVLHGNIFVNASHKGHCIIDNFYHFERGIPEYKNYKQLWATINVPHFARIALDQLLYINGQSKLSVSLPGAGCKCFRNSESPINSVMLMEDDNLAWSYEWVNGLNCIKFPSSIDLDEIRGLKNQWKIIEAIEAALENPNLYDIYLNGVANCEKYRLDNYIKSYIEPIIKRLL